MGVVTIRKEVYSVGAVDWDRRTFDSLIALPDGTSYNSYLVKGSQKAALLDTVDPSMENVLLNHLSEIGVSNIDYVIAHHAEQDHTGTLPTILRQYPTAKVLASPRCKSFLMDLVHIPPERIQEVQDGETISLGDRTLKFIYTPWVHWPETMVTYLAEEKILFSCDFFGSHLATTDLYVTDEGLLYEAAKRYYAEIMMPFHTNIEKDLDKLKGYEIEIIAPSHGPLYNNPRFILDLWHNWVFDEPKNVAILAYVTMHGSTRQMARYLNEALAARGVVVRQFDLTATDIGKLAMSLVDAATVILGTPTVLAGPHPLTVLPTFLANALRPKLKYAAVFGSYLWGGRAADILKSLIPNLNIEVLEPVMVKGMPKKEDFAALDKLADAIAERHKSLQPPASWQIRSSEKQKELVGAHQS